MIVLAAYAGDSVFGDTLWLLSSIFIFTFDKFGLGIAVLDGKIDIFILVLCFLGVNSDNVVFENLSFDQKTTLFHKSTLLT